ncbi:hypothetical protein EG831_02370 [bacterium]|nr:hypothetical protein [bacterium]
MYRLPADIVAAADRCPHGHGCLEHGRCGGRPLCAVSYADGRNVLVLADEGDADCPYRVRYGAGQVCACPAHYAIHMRHGA